MPDDKDLIYEVWGFGKESRTWFILHWGTNRDFACEVRDVARKDLGWSTAISWGKSRYSGRKVWEEWLT